ncbi:MAG TPA: hypothetical protein VMI54_17190 [Polyangiaceae bacterium]|nr:hypothetical protein [Polyangiaceae bacterium]
MSGLACAWALAACNGFDPSSLVPARPDADEAGAAGYSYDPGPSGGRDSTPTRPKGEGGSGAVSSLGAGGTTNTTPASAGANEGAGSAVGVGTAGTAASSRGGAGGASTARGGRGGSGGGGGTAKGGNAGTAAPKDDGGEGGTPAPLPRELFFSEYVEAGSDKGLEILALETTNLRGCEIATYFNGSTSPQTIALDAPVAAGSVYTLCSAKLAAKVTCDRTTNLSFNGNDAVALVCDGAILDVIGQIGSDPKEAWSNAGAGGAEASTADQTLRRRCGITHGDTDGTDPFDPAVQWVALPAETLDGLGDPACG